MNDIFKKQLTDEELMQAVSDNTVDNYVLQDRQLPINEEQPIAEQINQPIQPQGQSSSVSKETLPPSDTPSEFDPNNEYKRLLKEYESLMNQKPTQASLGDILPDALAGLYNISVFKDNRLPQMKLPNTFNQRQAQELASREAKQKQMSALLGEYRGLTDTERKNKMIQDELDFKKAAHKEEMDLKKSTAQQADVSEYEKTKQREYAKSETEYFTKDRQGLESNISKLDLASKYLSNPSIGSTISGPIRGLLPDFIRSGTNPTAIEVKELIHSAIQETLRPTLGAQFTENEGERIKKLAYNDQLSPLQNLKKVEELKKNLQKKVEASDAIYSYIARNKGSLEGFPYEKYGMRATGESSTPSSKMSPQDQQAKEWLSKNKDHPKAEEIRNKLKNKGLL